MTEKPELTIEEATNLGRAAFLAGEPSAPARNVAFMGRLASRVNPEFGSALILLKAFTIGWLAAHHKDADLLELV